VYFNRKITIERILKSASEWMNAACAIKSMLPQKQFKLREQLNAVYPFFECVKMRQHRKIFFFYRLSFAKFVYK